MIPDKEPAESIDPIPETSSTVRGPVSSGLLSDWSNGKAIDSQPTPQPNPATIK